MLKDIVLQQKIEKEKFLAQKYVSREKLDFAKKFLDSELIKVITGPRRAGKSVFATLLLQDKNFAYLNFDDENLLKVRNYDEILKVTFEVYPNAQFFLFDEIQNLPNWEIFVNKLQRRDYNLVLTGSNARLLSKEMGTALTGRYIPIEVLPFSFSEFLRAKNFDANKEHFVVPEVQGRILNYLEDYLKNGGFPEVIVKNLEAKTYLEMLFDAILFKDIVKRYQIRFAQKLYDLSLFLLDNFASEFSFTKLKNNLEFRSVNTVQNYLAYLREAYLIFVLSRFSFQKKTQIKAPKKVYWADSGFILAKLTQFSPNLGRLMENLVFVELLRRGYQVEKDIFYYQTKNKKEVDFLLKKGLKIEQLIQVCYKLDTAKERETRALIEASRALSCQNLIVINWDKEDEEVVQGKKIKFIPLWKWLIRKINH